MTVILDILKSLPTLLKCSKEGLMCVSPINLTLLSPANWELLSDMLKNEISPHKRSRDSSWTG